MGGGGGAEEAIGGEHGPGVLVPGKAAMTKSSAAVLGCCMPAARGEVCSKVRALRALELGPAAVVAGVAVAEGSAGVTSWGVGATEERGVSRIGCLLGMHALKKRFSLPARVFWPGGEAATVAVVAADTGPGEERALAAPLRMLKKEVHLDLMWPSLEVGFCKINGKKRSQ